jgi:hypothetical protein
MVGGNSEILLWLRSAFANLLQQSIVSFFIIRIGFCKYGGGGGNIWRRQKLKEIVSKNQEGTRVYYGKH